MNLKNRLLLAANESTQLANDVDFLFYYESCIREIIHRLNNGGKIYIAGNGGSAADSVHLAGELVGKINKIRPSIAAESLSSDIGVLTTIANDFGYEYVFSRQLQAKCTYKDVFIAISTSGNSKNILEALKVCTGYKILLCGNNGGQAGVLCDIVLNVGGNTADQIQQLHEIIYHSLVYDIEDKLTL